MLNQPCLFCGGDSTEPGHLDRCDGRQGWREAVEPDPDPFYVDGATYEPEFDEERLRGQWRRVFWAMRDGGWRTLAEVSRVTGDPEASISARLRDFRKARFGAH